MITIYNNQILKQILKKNYNICKFIFFKYTNYKIIIISHNFLVKYKSLLFIFLYIFYIIYLHKLNNIDKCKFIFDIYRLYN
jgi:hypothetical protein